MTSDANGWPDASKPGTPLNPERDGTHWLWVSQATGAFMAFQWHAPPGPDRVGAWLNISKNITTSHPLDAVRMGLTYMAPCLTPSEAQQRERAAAAAAWMAAREACAAVGDAGAASRSYGSWADAFEAAARRIRALPPPADAAAALAEVVRVAKREAFEEAAKIAEQEMRELFGDAEDWKQGWNAGLAVGVAAIRALGEAE